MKNEKLTKLIDTLAAEWNSLSKAETRILRISQKMRKFVESPKGEAAMNAMGTKERRDFVTLAEEIMEYAKARVAAAAEQ